ncbi:MAG TPA: hypothetical protein ENI19_02270 [Candidatus Nealsonbacteria bacterium]|uniref:Fibronectin type-III domain-containing protein n=1 Tax=marine sediment metagenome TaxID=412755 RepID=A0A0F9XTH2_9ZZZZ|nr:hypothetical protein [Candidatus Nealsonbacteria bacterium]HEB46512.1 hypothetical protein [Candidatus Nealsonbacteria bacterium]
MKKVIGIGIGILFILSIFVVPIVAEAKKASIAELQVLIEQLQQQIEELEAKIAEFQQSKAEVKEAGKEVKTTLRFIRQLQWGMTGEDVELLQEILKTDPEIYPEGLVTGYFGPLTYNAVKKFQRAAGIEQAGRVGPKTLSKINELLIEGVGSSGKVPPGLLIAPGIRKKLGYIPAVPSGQELPPGISKKLDEEEEEEEEEDVTPPLISGLSAIETTTNSTMITWVTDEEADSKVWHSESTPVDTEGPDPTVSDSELVLEHSLAIFDLVPDTTYYYVVSSTDDADNVTTSSESSFITLEEDTTAPVAVTDLSALNETTSSIDLSWTAPGDDGNTGTAASYDVRYSTSEITSDNWSSATQATEEPTPSVAGATESMTISGLSAETTYHFALKTSDEVPNESSLSNVPSLATSSE